MIKIVAPYQAYQPKPININQFLGQVEAILGPDNGANLATGPSLLLVMPHEAQRKLIKKALYEQKFSFMPSQR